ncbi:MAG: hypothetical protein DI527_01145 [Chelatococcus sp.]|nr:MAG: hypothetical protein DI527_01145 [Chelatococcus sp.]
MIASCAVNTPTAAAGSRLCRLLSLGKKRGGKAKCRLDWVDVVAHGEGLVAVLIPDLVGAECALRLRRLNAVAIAETGRLTIAAREAARTDNHLPRDVAARRLTRQVSLAQPLDRRIRREHMPLAHRDRTMHLIRR